MLRKWNRILAFILAMCLIATTFQSNLGTIRVFADDAPETITEEAPAAPVEEPAPEPEPEPQEEYVEEYSAPEEVVVPQETTPAPDVVEPTVEEQNIETPTEELPPEEIPVEEEIEEEEEEEEELPEEEEEPAQEKEPKMVTVKYRAELGGRVSQSSETIDINDEDAHFEGSTASAVNKYYQFTAWVDEEGNPVSSDSTFVPSDIEEDASYIAKFMKLENMPAQNFSGSAGGMDVTVSAGEGIFPEGTEMIVKAISDGEAIVAAQDALGETVKQAKGVDITFKNAEGEEIEPADSKYVNVSISLAKALEGESFSVVHKDDAGNAEEIGAASADGADFRTNSFSVYIIASVDGEDLERAVETYIFELYDVEDKEWKEVSTQRIKSGETLVDLGIPSLNKNQKFFGWIRQDNQQEVEFGPIETVQSTKTIVVKAIIKTTYHVTLIGTDEEVDQVLEAVVENDEDAMVTLNVTANPTSAEEAFEGWKNKAGVVYPYNEEIYASDPDNEVLTASMVSAYWIHFAENDGGSGGGASYTAPIYVTEDTGYKATKPADPTRSGYNFTGWYKDPECTQSFNWNTALTGNITLYAGWSTGRASFTVIIKKQSINDAPNSTEKTYDYEDSFVVSNYNAGTTITQGMLSGATGKTYKGFKYSRWEVVNSDTELGNKIAAKGTTVVNVYYDREVVTLEFYYQRNSYSTPSQYRTPMVGLYGQTLEFRGYTWPSEKVWHRGSLSGTHTTFLDAFIPPTGYEGYTIKYYYNENTSGSYVIRHIKQDLNGNYTIIGNETKSDGGNATFNFTEKYEGFTLVQYSKNGTSWTDTSAGQSVSYDKNLYIRYKRNSYKLDLMKAVEPVDPATGNPTGTTPVLVDSYDTLYEKPLSAMETTVRNAAASVTAPAGYKVKTDGQGKPILYADPQGKDIFVWGNNKTMPSNNVCVYVVFTKARYNVLLDLNVDGDKNINTKTGYDTVTHPNHQSTDFNPYYNAEISRDALMGFQREGYDLIGWFFASGPKEDQPYDYANVTGDVKIYAKWRKTGGVYINYDTNGGTINPDALDEHLYAADSAVVVTAPAYKEDFTFVGWMLLDKDGNDVARYYPNSSFNILDDYIAPGSDGKFYVTLRADYVPTGLNPDDLHTSFTYHPNGGGGSPVTISEIGEGDARHQLFVNEAVPVWSKAEAEANGFVREGYDLIGWNINKAAADAGEVQVGFDGKYVIADNDDNPDNPSANILYAVWKPQVVVHVYIEGAKNTKPYTGSEQQVSGFEVKKIEYKVGGHDYPSGSGFSPSDVKIKEAGLDTAKGTNVDTYYMGLTEDSFVSENPNFKKVVFHVTDGELTITPAAVNIKITGNKVSQAYDGEEHTAEGYTATADVTAYDVNKIAFSGTASATRKDKGTTDMGLSAGQFSNTDPNYTATFTVDDGSMTITPIDITVKIKGHFSTDPYDGQEHVVTGYDVEIPGSLYTEDDFTFSGEAKAARTNEGTTVMNLAASQFTNTNENFATVTFNVTDGYQTITKVGDVVVTITGHSNTKDYDGQEHSVSGYDVVISNPLYTENDFTFSGTDEAKGTDAGTYPMGLAASQFRNTNNNFKDVTFNVTDGAMEITPIDVTVNITGHHDTKTYDGQTYTVRGYDVKILNNLYNRDDFKFTGSAIASRKDEGTTNMGLDASQFENLNTTNFGTVTFNVTDGYMTIVPVDEVVVTITGNSATVDYNGQEQSVEGYEAEYSNPLYTASDFTFKGEAKAARTDVGTTNMTMKDTDFTNISTNFKKVTFVIDNGYITVNPISVTVTVKGHNDKVTYDGEEHTATGYDLTADNDLYDVSNVIYRGDATAARTDAGITQMELDKDLFENTDPNFSNVSFVIDEDGYIEVEPLEVTVTVKGNTREEIYNGSEYVVTGYKLEADNELYDANASVTYDGEAVARGTLPNTYDMGLVDTAFGNNDENFNVTFEVTDGFLKITDRPDGEKYTITVTVDDVTKEYTGEVFSGFGFNVAGGKQVKAQEGAAQNIVNFFTGILKPLTAGAADDDAKDPTVTIDGVTYKVMGLSIEQEQRNVGEYPLKVTGTMHIEDLEGHNMDAQFADPVITDGVLKITPRIMEVVSGSSQKVYDGTPLKNGTVTANRSWGIGDEISYDVTGSQTQVGSSNNTFTVVAGEGTDLKNYEINRIFGTLTVTNAPAPPSDNPTTIVDPPAPTAPTPVAVTEVPAVLGEQRGREGAAVLGARRGRTEDPANTAARVFAIVTAAVAAVLLILTGRKKKEEDED